jgi:hypothetical protein
MESVWIRCLVFSLFVLLSKRVTLFVAYSVFFVGKTANRGLRGQRALALAPELRSSCRLFYETKCFKVASLARDYPPDSLAGTQFTARCLASQTTHLFLLQMKSLTCLNGVMFGQPLCESYVGMNWITGDRTFSNDVVRADEVPGLPPVARSQL